MHKKTSHTPHLPVPVAPQPEAPHTRLGALRRGLGMRRPLMRRPWGWPMKIGAVIVGVFLVLLLAVNLFISADWVQARVAARIKEQTGRDLAVNGSTRLLFMPGPHIVITDAKITDPDAQAGTADFSVAKITIDLDFADLLSKQIDAERVVLVRPVLTIRAGGNAQPVRSGQRRDTPKKIRFAKAEIAKAEMTGMPKPSGRQMRLKNLRIKNGAIVIVYDDKDPSAAKRIENINGRFSLPSINARLIGKGRFDWKDQKVEFSFEVKTLADLRAKRPARLLLALDTRAIAARFDGTLSTSPEFSGQGQLSAKARSIPSVLAWMREKPTLAGAVGDGELASDLSWTKHEIKFANVRFALEHASGEGEAAISLNSPRPYVRAAFAFDHLDLNPFLGDANKKSGKKRNRPKKRADNLAPDAEAVEIVVGSPPMVAAPAGPSKHAPDAVTPSAMPPTVSLSRAASFDADVNLNIRKARFGEIDIGPSSLGFVFRDGVMNATLGGMELYGGNASGKLVLDATKPIPAFTGNLRLEGVETKPLLTDAAQFNMISGRTKLDMDVSGEGDDADEIKASLRGHGSVLVTDGSISGIDITAFIKGLGEGDFDLRQGPDAKTAFSNLGGGFTIANGIVETNNLNMVSPLLKVSAEGSVDLVQSTLDILAQPEITKAPKGKGGANALAGLSVPVRIEGPLKNPRIKPQIGSLFGNPENTSKAVNTIGAVLQKKFKGKPLGETIGRFLGNVQIGGPRRGKPPSQEQAAPRSAESDEEKPMDPDLEDILR